MRIAQFEGMAPRLDPSRLAEGLAAECTNASFHRGALGALPLGYQTIDLDSLESESVGALTAAKGLFYSQMAKAWFAFDYPVFNGVDSLIAPEDNYSRVYFANEQLGPRVLGAQEYTQNAVNKNPLSYRLGVPFPHQAPTVEVTDIGIPAEDMEDAIRQRVFYIYTLVDNFNHEGPPSAPSNHADLPTEYSFEVTVTTPVSGFDTADRSFDPQWSLKRFYRATQGTQGADYQYVGQVPIDQEVFIDTVLFGDEQEVIPSEDWLPPPEEIKHLDAVGSNFLAGFYGNLLCFSEVKLPHAWPTAYRFPLRYQIIAIKSTSNGLFIGTSGKPYWAFGADPQSAVPQEMDYDYPCLSELSIAEINGVVIYSSHDGLVGIDGREARLLTKDMFSTEDWKNLNPSTIKGFSFEGRYYFYTDSEQKVYSLDPTNPKSLTYVEIPSGLGVAFADMQGFSRDLVNDLTYLVVSGSDGSYLVELKNQASAQVTWKSPVFRGPPRAYTMGQVIASDYPVDLTVFSDGQTFTHQVTSRLPFRLPPWRLADNWQVELSFSSEGSTRRCVYGVSLVRSGEELIDG